MYEEKDWGVKKTERDAFKNLRKKIIEKLWLQQEFSDTYSLVNHLHHNIYIYS